MPFVVPELTALAVAAIFYSYRDHYLAALQRAKIVRERVAFLLWNAAQRMA
jgi:hypothetical protein